MTSIRPLTTRTRPPPLKKGNPLQNLLLKRSSQFCAWPGRKCPTYKREPWSPLSRQLPWSYRRHYHRGGNDDAFESMLGISKATGITTIAISICCAVFLVQWTSGLQKQIQGARERHDWIRKNVISSAENLKEGRWWSMFNSSFAHASLPHLAINMFALWNIGRTYITAFGFGSFAALWVVSAVACSAADIYWQNTKKRLQMESRGWDRDQKYTILGIPISRERALTIAGGSGSSGPQYEGGVGASGVLCGLVGFVLCFAPTLQVRFLFIRSPIWISEAIFVLGSGYCLATGSIPQIAHAGHLGGTAAGIAYYYGVARPWLRRTGRI